MNTKHKLKYIKRITNPFTYFISMLTRLPSIAFWGVKVKTLDDEKAVVTIRHRWTNQNPFKSIYFSALNGAAELSTGVLCQMHLQGRGPWSMLVVSFNASFYKKATGLIVFVCEDGLKLSNFLDQLEKGDKNGQIELTSKAYNSENIEIARFIIVWSFKKK